jgi:hypothetical protein
MSLLLNGSKRTTIAGAPLQLVEIYDGESYVFPLTFKDSAGAAVNITGWTFATTVKWYNATLVYENNTASQTNVTLSNLTLLSPQPTPNPPTGMVANITDAPNGVGYLYIPSGIDGGLTIGIDAAPALIAVVNLAITRTVSTKTVVTQEPIGLIIRYI